MLVEKKRFYYWLDPIRAIAAILVLLVHARSVMFVLYDNLGTEYHNIFVQLFYFICSQGYNAVCMFFILSGFLVGGRTIEKVQKGKESAYRFFLNRLFRIGVPLTGALLLIAVTNWALNLDVSLKQLLGQYTGLQGVLFEDYGGVFWTLSYEIWFYIIIGSFLLIKGEKTAVIGGGLFALSLAVFDKLPFVNLCMLLCGILCYKLKDYKICKSKIILLWIFAILIFIIDFVLKNNYLANSLGIFSVTSLTSSTQIILYSTIAIILSQYVDKAPESSLTIAINKYGKKIAVFSYSLFLTHYQVLKVWLHTGIKLDRINIETLTMFSLVCLTCIIVALIFYWIFERNTAKIQKYIERKLGIKA